MKNQPTPESKEGFRDNMPLKEQIDILAKFLMKNFDNEFGAVGGNGEGAVEMVIRLLERIIPKPESKECEVCKAVDELSPSMSYCATHKYSKPKSKYEEDSEGNITITGARITGDIYKPESKDWETVARNLAAEYATAVYFVHEENHPEKEKDEALDKLINYFRSEKKKSYEIGFEKAKDMIHIGDYYTNGLVDGTKQTKEEMKKDIIEFIENIKWDGRLSQIQVLEKILEFIKK